MASIKAVSIIRASSPKLVKVTLRRSAVKLSFNGYLMPFGKGRGGSQLNLDKVGVPLHSQGPPHLKESYKILDNIQILIISLNSTFCGRGSTKTKHIIKKHSYVQEVTRKRCRTVFMTNFKKRKKGRKKNTTKTCGRVSLKQMVLTHIKPRLCVF